MQARRVFPGISSPLQKAAWCLAPAQITGSPRQQTSQKAGVVEGGGNVRTAGKDTGFASLHIEPLAHKRWGSAPPLHPYREPVNVTSAEPNAKGRVSSGTNGTAVNPSAPGAACRSGLAAQSLSKKPSGEMSRHQHQCTEHRASGLPGTRRGQRHRAHLASKRIKWANTRVSCSGWFT